jgi:hypothetical protein
MKFKDLLVVPRGGFETHSKTPGYKELTQSTVLILPGSFVSATLSNINIFAIIIQRRNHAYLSWIDMDIAAVAEEPYIFESVSIADP